jgi:adenylate cyclase class IV
MKDQFYEIEIKSLLTEDKYNQLLGYLKENFRMIGKDSIHTIKFLPGDIRLRKSGKIKEVVCKEPDVTKVGRKEIKIPIADDEDFDAMQEMLLMLGLELEAEWIKHKTEFIFPYKGYDYTVCLQHIENFAYILEVEFIADVNNFFTHEPNIREIIRELGCEPINPIEFLKRVDEYREQYKKFK